MSSMISARIVDALGEFLFTSFSISTGQSTVEHCTYVPHYVLTRFEGLSFNLVVLAVQNMNACNAVDKAHEIEFKALEDSLNMMSKGRF